MGSRLLSVGLLVASLAIGYGTGRALGPQEDTATPPTTTTLSAAESPDSPNGEPPAAGTRPTLGELVPGLDHPLYLETANPTQLLRWDLDEPAPVPVRHIPAGRDLDMDRDARFVIVAMASDDGDLLLGGLAGTPLALLDEDVSSIAARSDFTDTFWFVRDDNLVAMNTRAEVLDRHPIPDLSLGEGEAMALGSPVIALTDEAGIVVEQWHTLADGRVVVSRALIDDRGRTDLPGGENSFAAGLTPTTVFIRTREGALTIVDRATGKVIEAAYDGSCGPTHSTEKGLVAALCRGMVSVFFDPPLNHVGTWTSGRWSGSDRWFLAVGGYFGSVLLVDATTAEATVVAFELPAQTLVVDAWSGA